MSAQYPHILVTDTDYDQLMTKLEGSTSEEALPLFEELNRASIVPEKHIPPDTVTMNSRVRYKDFSSPDESEITIVYPAAANVAEKKISILAPVATALLGLRVGDRIRWPMPGGVRILEVIASTINPKQLTPNLCRCEDVKQKIIDFHLDEENHWVADLECGHSQHMRHDPPWTVREWINDPKKRRKFLGGELECKKCDEDLLTLKK